MGENFRPVGSFWGGFEKVHRRDGENGELRGWMLWLAECAEINFLQEIYFSRKGAKYRKRRKGNLSSRSSS